MLVARTLVTCTLVKHTEGRAHCESLTVTDYFTFILL